MLGPRICASSFRPTALLCAYSCLASSPLCCPAPCLFFFREPIKENSISISVLARFQTIILRRWSRDWHAADSSTSPLPRTIYYALQYKHSPGARLSAQAPLLSSPLLSFPFLLQPASSGSSRKSARRSRCDFSDHSFSLSLSHTHTHLCTPPAHPLPSRAPYSSSQCLDKVAWGEESARPPALSLSLSPPSPSSFFRSLSPPPPPLVLVRPPSLPTLTYPLHLTESIDSRLPLPFGSSAERPSLCFPGASCLLFAP